MIEYFYNLFKGTKCDLYKIVYKDLKEDNKRFIITANPEAFMYGEKDVVINKMLLDKDNTIVADGIGIVKAAHMLNVLIPERIPGVDIANELLKYGNELKKSVYFFGSKQEVLDLLKQKVQKDYPNLIVVGAQHGYEKDRQKVFNDIIKQKPDIVLVALGIPEQEKLIYDNINKFNKGIFVGVGGSLDVISGQKKRAPKIFIKLNLEWLYRILKEPKRIKRFYNNNIKFLIKIKNISKKGV